MPKRTGDSKRMDLAHDAIFVAGLFAMVALVYAVTFLGSGTLPQKAIFFLGALVLFFVAHEGKQKVLVATQAVIILGTVLAFVPSLPTSESLLIMLIAAVLLVAYLVKIGSYRKEAVGALGTVGFILLAAGFALNNVQTAVPTAFALGFGALILAIYALLHFVLYRVRIQIIWFILDAAFCISPLMFFFAHAVL